MKIQCFIKIFIWLYFDYDSCLLIYYPKSSIQSLFNLCLLRLLNFKPEKLIFEDILVEAIKIISWISSQEPSQNTVYFIFIKDCLKDSCYFLILFLIIKILPLKLAEKIKIPDSSTINSEVDQYYWYKELKQKHHSH